MLNSYSMNKPEVVSSVIVLVRGQTSENKDFWAYMCMLPNQAEMFMHARKKGRLDLDDYGTMLESGEGEPCGEVKKRMQQQFGFRDDFEETLLKMLRQQGGA